MHINNNMNNNNVNVENWISDLKADAVFWQKNHYIM